VPEPGSSGTVHATRPTRDDAPRSAPMSTAQRRLWFLHQLDPDDHAYHICLALEVRGQISPHAVGDAVASITRRHDALRSTFHVDGARPVRRVRIDRPTGPHLVDLSGQATGDGDLARHLDRLARRPFDLAAGPVARWYMLRLDPRRHLLVLTVHHIVFDGGCLPILCHELEAAYSAFLLGRPDPHAQARLAPLPSPDGHDPTADLAYWRARLGDAPPPLSVWASAAGLDRERPPRHRHAVTATAVLDGDLLRRLRTAVRRRGATLFITLLATLAAVLRRYTGQDDVVIGTPVSTRDAETGRDRIDLQVNLVPLRLRPTGELPFEALVRDARDAVLDALDHHRVPFERIVDELRPERTADSSPLFQVLFVHQQAPTPPRLPGVAVTVLPSPTPAAKYHLTVTATEGDDRLELAFDADAAECDTGILDRFAHHFCTTLAAALDDPAQPLARLSLLTGDERAAPVATDRAWAACERDEHRTCLHHLVEDTAAARADAIAVVADDNVQLSYRELDRRANRLAHALRTRGAGPERAVAIHLPRTADLVVALLAALKSGAAYLPLDPAQPPHRLRLMLGDARPAVLLTTDALARALDHETTTVRVDADRDVIAAQPGSRPAVPVRAANLAYLLYTSGSTGRPKGVAIEHASAVEFLRWSGEAFSHAELAAVLATTSVGFDLSVFELFAPLAHGGTVVLTAGPGDLAEHPGVPHATLLNTVPSVLETLLNSDALPPALATVNLAGEPLRPDLVDRLLRRRPGVRVGNLYGPSEATTYATVARLRANQRQSPIGHAAAGAELWLTDEAGQPVPPGVAGEILIGGSALARGYLGQPAMTAQRFIPDGLGDRPGARVYRTGDLGRIAREGDLLFLGRLDNQVKLRGVRIEPEEIEALLQRHGSVREAAVILAGEHAQRRLVGFVCRVDGAATSAAELAEHLRERLPPVMIPSNWVFVDRLPRTPNGKLDRRALAGQASRAEPVALGGVPPRSALERTIAEAWCEILALPSVGVYDRFFDLGGNSLRLLELQAALRRRVDRPVRLVDLFRCPTVAALARFFERHDEETPAARGSSRGTLRRTAAVSRRTGRGTGDAGAGRS
jgi:amino acid adenylation domain-containing protein